MRNHALLLTALGSLLGATAQADILYSTIPSPVPPNTPSVGYQANQTAEFGQGVDTGTPAILNTANILMSNWALESTYETVGTSAGFNVPMTLNIYDVGPGDTVGALLGSYNVTQLIDWRPEASAGCTGGAWMAADNNCYNGISQVVSFNLGGLAVSSQFIWGLAFNTETWGANPIGTGGPYNSLNVGTSAGPIVGSDLVAGSAFWNTSTAGNYSDGGAGGVGTFRQDTGWTGFDPGASFDGTATPEPMTLGMIGFGMLGMAIFARRRAK